ncbi:MAG: hypothetical protein AB7E61_01260 [Acholeplasmataceae bacterium]
MVKHLKFGNVVIKYTFFDESYFGDTLKQYETNEKAMFDIQIKYEHILKDENITFKYRGLESFYLCDEEMTINHYHDQTYEVITEALIFDFNAKQAFIKIDPTYVKDINMQSYILSGIAFMEVALAFNNIPIHGSAISYQNQGMIFSAPSGTGKSTQRTLWQTYLNDQIIVINDDKPMIYKNHQFMVTSMPFSGKSKMSTHIEVPLKAIIFLKQASKPKIQKLDDIHAVKYMLENVYRPAHKTHYEWLLTMIHMLLEEVDIYLLEATKEKDTFDILYDTLFGGNKNEN